MRKPINNSISNKRLEERTKERLIARNARLKKLKEKRAKLKELAEESRSTRESNNNKIKKKELEVFSLKPKKIISSEASERKYLNLVKSEQIKSQSESEQSEQIQQEQSQQEQSQQEQSQQEKQISVIPIINTSLTDLELTYSDPNVYLLTHPEKSEWAKVSPNINYTHVIITRFSYRFRKGDPIGNLFSPARMKRRFQLLEAFCFPSITSQINPNFYWILVIDEELPTEYLNRLHQLIARFYESSQYKNRGPRQIILHKWKYTCPMSSVEWLRESDIPIDNKKYLVTTRLDDDDSLCRNFTNLVYSQLAKNAVRGFYLLTFEFGYYWYSSPKLKYGVFKISTRPYIALGLTLVTHLKKYPFTIYFGNHTRLVYYIKNYKEHKLLRKMFEKNKETVTDKNFSEKYYVVKRTEPVFIRTIHDQGLQRGQQNIYRNSKLVNSKNPKNAQNLTQVNKGFQLNLRKVEKVNSKI